MIGPLPLSKSGSQYILVAIDSFARFLRRRPIPHGLQIYRS